MKTYEYTNQFGQKYLLSLSKATYASNGNTAVKAEYFEEEFGCWLPYGNLTVNLEVELPAGYAFAETNNFYGVVEWMEANGIATATGQVARSGFCEYPLVKFNESAFEEVTE